MASTGSANGSGIPTATNVDHIALVVADLDAAASFFVDVIGGAEVFRAGPFTDPEGAWMPTQFAVPPGASGNIVMVRLGPTQVVELMAWDTPDQLKDYPRNSDVGATHVAIHVTDIKAAVEYLTAHGCSPCGEPLFLEHVPHAGTTILYMRTPVGLYIELVNHPDHPLPYEESTDVRLLPSSPEWRNN